MRIRRHPGDVNFACSKMNEEQDIMGDQPETRPYLRREEISSYQNVHVISDELSPRRLLLALVNRGQSVPLQYICHSRATYSMSYLRATNFAC